MRATRIQQRNPYMVCVIVHATISERCKIQGLVLSFHATISEWRRLQCFHIWFGVIIHATISEQHKLQCFHIWLGVIIHTTMGKWRRLQCFHYGLVLSFMPR